MVWDGREHCVCELMRELGASQSRMSRHMTALKAGGLVVDRRDAQWVRCRRSPNLPQEVVALVDVALAMPQIRKGMQHDPQFHHRTCARHRPFVTNTMGQDGADFEKGEADGTREALLVLGRIMETLFRAN